MGEPCGALEQPAGSAPLRAGTEGAPGVGSRSGGAGRPRSPQPVVLVLGGAGPGGPALARKSQAGTALSPEAPGAGSVHPRERGMWDWTQLPSSCASSPTYWSTGSNFRGCGGGSLAQASTAVTCHRSWQSGLRLRGSAVPLGPGG